jgi:hypothetical protein
MKMHPAAGSPVRRRYVVDVSPSKEEDFVHDHTRGQRRSTRFQSQLSQIAYKPAEMLEPRLLLSATIVGSSTVYSTISAAVNAAAAGATINVGPGNYAETVTITKQLTIDGAQTGVDARSSSRANGTASNSSIITGGSSGGSVGCAFYVDASNVTISGFTVQNETSSNVSNGAGIVIAPNIAGTHILDNIVQNNVAGLFLSNNSSTNAVVIQYNVFQNNNNNGSNGGRGIYTDGTISGGNLTNVTIDSNNFINNRGGSGTTGLEAACAFEGQTAGDQSNIRITNNTFTNNGKSVLFMDTTGVLIQGNTATGAADWYSGSLRFEGNNHNVTIQYNNIDDNPGPGVAVDSSGVPGDSSGFVVNYNNIFGNGTSYSSPLGVVFNDNNYDGTFDARYNYWGSSTGPSGDGPGTGNAVYGNASKGNSWTFAKGGPEIFSPWSTTSINIANANLPTPPTGLAASASSTSQINLTWGNTGTNQTGVEILRSTNGTTFTSLTTVSATATSYSDTNLTTGATDYYELIAVNSSGNSSPSNIASATTLSGNTLITQLSSLNWVSATAGWGSVQKNLSVGGNPITLNGVVYSTGIGTHAVSNIVYNLAGNYTTFQSDIGVDAEEDGKGTGSVIFEVIGDGKTLYTSGVLTNSSPTVHVNVSVAGVQQLTLVATNGVANSIDYDHSDWAGAELIASVSTVPSAPTGLSALAATPTKINMNWVNPGGNQTGSVIQRSTNGGAYSTIATVAAGITTNADTTVSAGNKYSYQILASNAAGNSSPSTAASVTTPAASTAVTQLSSLTWTSATVGWGTIQKNADIKGTPITLRGTVYSSGIGTHANSTIDYNLAGAYATFSSDIGIDDDSAGQGSVDFQIIGDGKVLYDSGTVIGSSPVQHVTVSVAGVQQLSLVVTTTTAGDIDYDHADWAGAELLA